VIFTIPINAEVITHILNSLWFWIGLVGVILLVLAFKLLRISLLLFIIVLVISLALIAYPGWRFLLYIGILSFIVPELPQKPQFKLMERFKRYPRS